MKKLKKKRAITVDKKVSFSEVLDAILDRYGAWIAFGIVSLLLLSIFHDFILGKAYYLFSDIAMDSVLYYFPNLLYFSRYLYEEGFPFWSFAQGMGQNIMAAGICDPFYWIVYLTGTSNAPYSIIWMQIAKTLLAGAAFYHFLRLWNLTALSRITGTLLYCFSGFMFVGGQWWIFSTEASYLAILLLSFEKLYRQNSWYLFPLAVALIGFYSPFVLYTSSLFLFAYLLFRHFSSEEPRSNVFFSLFLKTFCLGLLGLMMSSLSLVGNIQRFIESPRVSGDFSYFNTVSSISVFALENPEHYVTALLRFLSNDLMGNGVAYSGWHNYLEAPLFYIGLLPLLLLPQVFTLFNGRRLIVYASLLAVFLIPVVFPYFRYAFFLFSGDYYRVLSLFVSLAILFPGLYALDEIQKNTVNRYTLLGTFLILAAILYFPYHMKITNVNITDGAVAFFQNTNGMLSIDTGLRSVIILFLVAYVALIFLCNSVRYRSFATILLLTAVATEIGYMNSASLKDRRTLSKLDLMAFTDDSTMEAVSRINAADKGFYRLNISTDLTSDIRLLANKAKVQGYYGTSSYDPFNQKYYIRFLEELGILHKGSERESRLCYGLIRRPSLWSFAGIKYHIGKKHDAVAERAGFKVVEEVGAAAIYKNSRFLPLGYTYDRYMPLSKFRLLSDRQKELVLMKAVVVEEPVAPEISGRLNELNASSLFQDCTEDAHASDTSVLGQNTFEMNRFSQNRIEGAIKLDAPKLLFFTIPYDKGWRAVIDKEKVSPQLCNIGFFGFVLEPGCHTVELSYVPPYFSVSLIVSVLGIFIYLGLIAGRIFLIDRSVSGSSSALLHKLSFLHSRDQDPS